MTTNQTIDGVPRDPCQWTDLQILDFLGVALRNVDLVGTVKLSEIRQGFEYMRNKQQAAQPQGEPVAEVVSKFGDPEAFGEREIIVRQDLSKIPYGTKLYRQPPSPALTVWYGAMPESNGKTNWTAILHRKGESLLMGFNITIDRSEYPDRVRYEADRMRYMIGELESEPDMMSYDEKLHSGYVRPEQPAPVAVVMPTADATGKARDV